MSYLYGLTIKELKERLKNNKQTIKRFQQENTYIRQELDSREYQQHLGKYFGE